MSNVITLKVAPWPVPHGWKFVQEDMPSIVRIVGDYNLIVAEDDGEWVWWLCPAGDSMSVSRGDAFDMIDGITRALDAFAKAVGA
jgi:hypothetical protein